LVRSFNSPFDSFTHSKPVPSSERFQRKSLARRPLRGALKDRSAV
jgi:hypothetical protein